jgi:hypothetical protein
MKMKRAIIVILALLLIPFNPLFLAGCKNIKVPPPKKDPTDQLQPVSKKLNIDVFIDGSVSMLGFVSPGDFTYYSKTLQILQDTAITGSPDGHVTFSKFSSQVNRLGEQEVLKARRLDFYNGPATRIDKVIETASDKNLTILITDLFQNEADTALLIRKITDKYLRLGLAVGVVGIRSQFSGQVYDIGINDLNFNYNSGFENPKRFRPLYMMLLGKHADIENFFELLKHNGFNKFPETQYVIFSPYLVNPPPAFADAEFETMTKMIEISGLVDSNIKDKRLRQFRIKAMNGGFRIAFELNPLPYTLSYDSKQLEANIIISKFSPQGKTMSINPDSNIITVGNFSTLKQKLVFDTEIHSLVEKGVYIFDITIFPTFTAYKNPLWFSEWDMKTERIAEWRKNPLKFEGSTTFNLERLLTGLWQANWQIQKPKVAHIFCYIENR